MNPMHDVGRFKRRAEQFYGTWTDHAISRLALSPFIEPATQPVRQYDPADLVFLPPCQPRTIVLPKPTSDDDLLLVAPCALAPHRSMLRVAKPDSPHRIAPGIAAVIGQRAYRCPPDQVAQVVFGLAPAQAARDAARPPNSTRARSYESYLPIGPAIRPGVGLHAGDLELRHNSEVTSRIPVADLLINLFQTIADVTDVITLEPEDVILFLGPESTTPLRPGDHLETVAPDLRRLATNVGMRGSA